MSKTKALSPWLKNLGDNIRRERMSQEMAQQQLAEFADLNIRNVQRIEGGEIDVLLTTMVRIRKALGCPLDRLLPKDFELIENKNFRTTKPDTQPKKTK